MTLTPSNMLPLGTKAPNFNLKDVVSGKTFNLIDLTSDVATVIMFICNHCPFVKHVESQLVQLAKDYQPKGISVIAICANDAAAYPDDSFEKMREIAMAHDYSFPYLHDETQATARAYQAACTPDFYIFDSNNILVYRGQLDDSRPGNNIPVTGKDLRNALDKILAGKTVGSQQKASIGCNIKWKEV